MLATFSKSQANFADVDKNQKMSAICNEKNEIKERWNQEKKGTLCHSRTPHSFFWSAIWRCIANQKKTELEGTTRSLNGNL